MTRVRGSSPRCSPIATDDAEGCDGGPAKAGKKDDTMHDLWGVGGTHDSSGRTLLVSGVKKAWITDPVFGRQVPRLPGIWQDWKRRRVSFLFSGAGDDTAVDRRPVSSLPAVR